MGQVGRGRDRGEEEMRIKRKCRELRMWGEWVWGGGWNEDELRKG